MAQATERHAERVVVVEDDQIARLTLLEQLADAGYEVTGFERAEEALAAVGKQRFDVAVSDVRLPSMDGIAFVEQARALRPEMIFIMVTGFGTVENAVRAMKLGAADYLCKPVSADEILLRIERSLAFRRTRTDRDRLQREIEKRFGYHNLIGRSEAMQHIFSIIETIKDIDSTVLIEGETGTGKDMLARAIHYASARRTEPFIAVNCMVLSRDLLESELFGHERGAFTGALAEKPGRFELAGRGTVLLDDVDDIPLDLQGKLVYVMENRECERVGGTRRVPLACRVLCSTKKDLLTLVERGKFRDDLYYRMNVVKVSVPPLRERKEDIPFLVEHFAKIYAEQIGRQAMAVGSVAMQLLLRHDWPGNVRELRHVIERAIALNDTDELAPHDLPAALHEAEVSKATCTLHLPDQGHIRLPALLQNAERQAIQWAMTQTDGHQADAAELLGIPRTTLQAKLQKMNQQP